MSKLPPLGGFLRIVFRLPLFLLHLLLGLSLALLLRLVFGSYWMARPAAQVVYLTWMRVMAVIVGLRVEVQGGPVEPASMIVSNHVSWLDIISTGCVHPSVFVAKSEVSRWPLIGPLCQLVGTVFIRRASIVSMNQSIGEVEKLLRHGCSASFFAEGTTTRGDHLEPFKASLFQAAINSERPLQPLALRYPDSIPGNRNVPFVGDDTFVAHLLRMLQAPLKVEIRILPAIPSGRYRRRELAEQARRVILTGLELSDPPQEIEAPEQNISAQQ